MAPLFLLFALPATLIATVEAAGFFRGLRPLPMPVPFMPLVHPLPLLHPMPFPLLPFPHPPIMPIRRPSHPSKIRNEIRSAPVAAPANDRRSDVIVVINDRDCYSGLCQGDGLGQSSTGYLDSYDLMSNGLNNGLNNYNIHDADHVVIRGNGRY